MIKKLGVSALLCAGVLGLGAMQAQAQTATMQSQTFPFGPVTCSGGNNVVGTPPIIFTDINGNVVRNATISSANITLFQAPTGLQYAYMSISGGGQQVLSFLGPGGGSVTTGFGSAGNFNTSGVTEATPGNGVNLPLGAGINLTVACASGTWQAFGTIWYHVP